MPTFIAKRACEGAATIDRGDMRECPHSQCGVRVAHDLVDHGFFGFASVCPLKSKGKAVSAPARQVEMVEVVEGGERLFVNVADAAPAQGEPLPVQFIPKRACEGAQTLCVFTDRERQCPHQQCAEVVTFRHVPTVAETTEAFKAMCPLNKPASSPVSAELLRALINRWRAKAAEYDSFHATLGTGWKVCADELEQALASPVKP